MHELCLYGRHLLCVYSGHVPVLSLRSVQHCGDEYGMCGMFLCGGTILLSFSGMHSLSK